MFDFRDRDMDNLENRLRTMDWYRDHLHDMEGLAPDTHGCECLFLDCFLTEEMISDFPYIVHDFLKHRMGDISLDRKETFIPEEPETSFPTDIMRNTMLNIMYSDAKGGNEYSRELFRTLYRTYYRREYQQLKRFRTMSASEAVSLAEGDEEGYRIGAISRILCIARLFDIEVQTDCAYIYHVLNRNWKEREEEEQERYDHVLFMECRQQAED